MIIVIPVESLVCKKLRQCKSVTCENNVHIILTVIPMKILYLIKKNPQRKFLNDKVQFGGKIDWFSLTRDLVAKKIIKSDEMKHLVTNMVRASDLVYRMILDHID